MDNSNFQADKESWMNNPIGVDKEKRPVWRRIILPKKTTAKDVYDTMIRSDVKFPTEFKLKGKKITFKWQAKLEPVVSVKGKVLVIDRNMKNKNMSLKDSFNVKANTQAIKDAVAGVENTRFTITEPHQYFALVCEAMFDLFYSQIDDKYITRVRSGRG